MPIKIIPYEPYLKLIARKLRQNMTKEEVMLWNKLKNKQLQNYDFDRQKPLLRYIVDFYCKELKLAIELDGNHHYLDEYIDKDKVRQKELEEQGVVFLRFSNETVRKDMNNVIWAIEAWIEKNKNNAIKIEHSNLLDPPLPLPRGDDELP